MAKKKTFKKSELLRAYVNSKTVKEAMIKLGIGGTATLYAQLHLHGIPLKNRISRDVIEAVFARKGERVEDLVEEFGIGRSSIYEIWRGHK